MVTRRMRPSTRRRLRPQRFIVTNVLPRSGFRVDSTAYDILANRFGIEEQDFSIEEAEDLLSQQGLRNQAQFILVDLINQSSISQV